MVRVWTGAVCRDAVLNHPVGDQAGERDEGICGLQGRALKDVDQRSADDRADAVDRSQVCDMFFAIGTCLDQIFYALVDASNDLIEALSQRFEVGGKSNHTLKRLAQCLTQGTQLGTAFEKSINLALFR
jgi:hypothetical protein